MRRLGLVIGALVILASAISVAAPDLRLSLEGAVMTPVDFTRCRRQNLRSGWCSSRQPASRAPRMVRVLGLIVIVAGLTTPWFGVTRARAVLDWLKSAGPWLMHLHAGVGMALGAFLVYVPNTDSTRNVMNPSTDILCSPRRACGNQFDDSATQTCHRGGLALTSRANQITKRDAKCLMPHTPHGQQAAQNDCSSCRLSTWGVWECRSTR